MSSLRRNSIFVKRKQKDVTDYSLLPFTITSLEDGNVIKLNINQTSNRKVQLDRLSWKKVGDLNWQQWTNDNASTTLTLATLNTNESVEIKGYGTGTSYGDNVTYCSTFNSTKKFKVSGNIMSLLYEDDYVNKTTITGYYAFNRLFVDCSTLYSIKDLVLPATSLSLGCYNWMFVRCSNLVYCVKQLPAVNVAELAYNSMFYACSSMKTTPIITVNSLSKCSLQYMFYNCTNIVDTSNIKLNATRVLIQSCCYMFYGCSKIINTPQLPATTLDTKCYYYMFYNCTSLTSAPTLPATTLAAQCYSNMFENCTNLTIAPDLLAETLSNNCYSYMFRNCSNLKRIKAMFTTTPSNTYTNSWVSGVSSSGTFIKNSAASWNVTGNNGVPTGWTIQAVES